MRYMLFVVGVVVVLSAAGVATAGPVCFGGEGGPGFARFEGMGGPFGWGGFGHGFWHGGGWGPWGCGFVNLGEKQQERFQTRYDDFVADYDAAVAEDPNFYDSELYQDMLDRFGRLVDRYDRFVSREEWCADGLDLRIDSINDRIEQLNELLADGPPEDLPERCAENFEERIQKTLDWLTERLDTLTEKSETLAGNIETYLAFQTDLEAYRDEITNAGQELSELLAAMGDWSAAEKDSATASADEALMFERFAPLAAGESASVPEPGIFALAAGALVALLVRRSR